MARLIPVSLRVILGDKNGTHSERMRPEFEFLTFLVSDLPVVRLYPVFEVHGNLALDALPIQSNQRKSRLPFDLSLRPFVKREHPF
jgi:hypothetical protein